MKFLQTLQSYGHYTSRNILMQNKCWVVQMDKINVDLSVSPNLTLLTLDKVCPIYIF